MDDRDQILHVAAVAQVTNRVRELLQPRLQVTDLSFLHRGVQVAAVVRGVSKVIADIGCGIGDANGDVVIR